MSSSNTNENCVKQAGGYDCVSRVCSYAVKLNWVSGIIYLSSG